ncbi:TRAP-type C4-dicarboxylate transport system large permease component [Vibrio variabilis]|uniref:TRAP-type C4-dicarboxylate transport system large permease component n=1 Tax=Vibrio variabilis TaxID=990271 RepID=A0ABQ0JL60_9VIBR|nr:TRAP-type C4-dicarboxylate transport system large permease component [Vibrio variabilis]
MVIILGGIYGGVFTPTEAAAVAAVYSFLIANFIYKDMGPFADKENKKPALVKVFETLCTKILSTRCLKQASSLLCCCLSSQMH